MPRYDFPSDNISSSCQSAWVMQNEWIIYSIIWESGTRVEWRHGSWMVSEGCCSRPWCCQGRQKPMGGGGHAPTAACLCTALWLSNRVLWIQCPSLLNPARGSDVDRVQKRLCRMTLNWSWKWCWNGLTKILAVCFGTQVQRDQRKIQIDFFLYCRTSLELLHCLQYRINYSE